MPQVLSRRGRQARPPRASGAAPGSRCQGGSAAARVAITAAVVAGLLAGCSNALDWRQMQPEGWAVTVALPCRPSSQQRTVPLAGQPVALSMLACSADDHLFAVASADLADPARVAPALQALGDAARENLRARVLEQRSAAVPGMTPNPAARHWRLAGQRPDGQPVAEQVLVFAHGTRVFQATLLGPQADDSRAQPFFEAIRVLP